MSANVVQIHDINHALPMVLPMLYEHGVRHTAASLANQRETIEWPGVFVSEYLKPTRNVLFDPDRDANPFFHYLEALWILAGRNDVKFLAYVLPKVRDYSDNGEIFHGAYGHRLRSWNGTDQLNAAVERLRAEPTTRQVVLGIWNPARDIYAVTKDLPCNDTIALKIRDGRLNITVFNRSNDAIWGCYGANVVQFSMLQMYLAYRIGCRVGTYTQVSDSFHVYTDNPYFKLIEPRLKYNAENPYGPKERTVSSPYLHLGESNLFENSVLENRDEFDIWLGHFFEAAMEEIDTPVVYPVGEDNQWERIASGPTPLRDGMCMLRALKAYRLGDHAAALNFVDSIVASDWSLACRNWMVRRIKKATQPVAGQ